MRISNKNQTTGKVTSIYYFARKYNNEYSSLLNNKLRYSALEESARLG